MNLKDTQRSVMEYICHDEAAALELINNKGCAKERLDIYKDGYLDNLTKLLGSAFFGLKTLMGDVLFKEMSTQYFKVHPSVSTSVRDLGENLLLFLNTHKDFVNEEGYAEMASFEGALQATTDAANADRLSVEDLTALPQDAWASLHFTRHPSVQFVELYYNVDEIWLAALKGETLPALVKREKSIWFVLWRFNHKSHYQALSEEAYWMLASFDGKHDFSEVCEGLCQWVSEEQAAEKAVQYLVSFVPLLVSFPQDK